MFGSQILEVAIGLVFVYWLLSLVCSAFNEIIAQAFNVRGEYLAKAMRKFLESASNQNGIQLDVDGLYNSGLIKPLLKQSWIYNVLRVSQGPSYISAKTFSLALFDTILTAGNENEPKDEESEAAANNTYSWTEQEKEGLINIIKQIPSDLPNVKKSMEVMLQNGVKPKGLQGYTGQTFNQLESAVKNLNESPVKEVLQSILEKAKTEAKDWDQALAQARTGLEEWFDGYMDRVSGWYKRYVQVFVLALALLISIFFNVDTFAIGQALYRDNSLRAAVANSAIEFVKQESEQTEDKGSFTIDKIQSELHNLGLPIGWVTKLEQRDNESAQQFEQREVQTKLDNRYLFPNTFARWMTKIFGILFTALAISLGAPFWFDVLSKVANLRSTGKVPDNNTQTATKSET